MSGSVAAAPSQQFRRVSRRRLAELAGRLTGSDFDTLRLLGQHRFLATGHVAGLVYGAAASRLAGVRAAQRALRKLESQHLVAVLPRRVGGYGGGAAQSVWHLTEAGRRLLRHRPGSSGSSGSLAASGEGWRRVRFTEPSPQFLAHTLRVADICLVLEQLGAASGGELGLAAVQTEPECWRVFTGPYGALSALRPDLYAEVASLEFLDCWFIEADMATEHLPAIVRKARVYEAYRALGREQAVRGVFPLVLWVTPDGRRAEAIMRAIGQDSVCDVRAHQAVAMAGLAARLADPRPG